MAFTIKIYDKDEYIYQLLKRRLSNFFPDAYIVNPYFDSLEDDDRFSDYTKVLYNPKAISDEDINLHAASPIRLTEDGGLIDCARFVPMLRNNSFATPFLSPVTGTVTAVLPFVYSNERDRFILDLEKELTGADFNVRLDFTSKIRALWRQSAGSNMTSLLEACKSKKFAPEDILKYCNMDDSGFLTPGSTTNNDDVYDMGLTRSVTLMHHATNLVHRNNKLINVLAVVEGFRSVDLPDLLSGCDMVTILLPARNAGEDIGAQDLITLLKKTLGQERVSVRYINEASLESSFDDILNQRRQVV